MGALAELADGRGPDAAHADVPAALLEAARRWGCESRRLPAEVAAAFPGNEEAQQAALFWSISGDLPELDFVLMLRAAAGDLDALCRLIIRYRRSAVSQAVQ